MKSSPKVHPEAINGQFQTWTPPDFGFEFVETSIEIQKERIQSIFHHGKTDDVPPMGSRSALYKAGTGQVINAWRPGEMASRPNEMCRADWTFFGGPDIPLQAPQQHQKFETEMLKEDTYHQQEKEAMLILERARAQADEIILAAQAEADKVLLQAQDEIDEQKKEAYQEGQKQIVGELEDALNATHTMVEEVLAWKAELMSQGEQILVEMLIEIAQKMFGEGVDLSQEALQINLNRIMESAQGLGSLNIFLNPRDAKTLDPSWSEYQMLVTGDKVKIIPSGKITRGGCYVKGDMGNIDGRVETQLHAILKSFEDQSEATE